MSEMLEEHGLTSMLSHRDVLAKSSRRLGYIESVMAMMQKKMRGTTQLAQIVHLKGQVDYLSVLQASKRLFERYAILRCSIKEAGGALEFAEVLTFNQIPIRHVPIDAADEWEKIFADEVDIPLAQSIWRVTLISGSNTNNPKIVIVVNHAIIDSVAIKILTTQFLGELDRVIVGETTDNIRHPIPSPIDDYLKSPRKVLPKSTSDVRMRFKRAAPLEARRTRWVVEALDANQLTRLRERCVQEKIKVHSLLSAALCLAAHREGLADTPVPLRTAVSLRVGERNRPDEQELSCCISVADTPIAISSDDNIKTAALAYDETLFKGIATDCLHRRNVDIGAIAAFTQKLKVSDVFMDGFAITTVEEPYDLPNVYRAFWVEDFVMIVNRSAGNFAVGLQVTVQHDEMRFIFVYPHPLWDEETVRTLSRAFIKRLTDF